jgi:hypothetical protein
MQNFNNSTFYIENSIFYILKIKVKKIKNVKYRMQN